MIITLDGPAGSGKSTVAKIIAKELSLNQIDSGAFYRSYTYMGLQFARQRQKEVADVVDTEEFKKYILEQKLHVEFRLGRQVVLWNNEDLEQYIRLPEITAAIKFVADSRFIRELVNARINVLSKNYSVIADGRDMGTVVYPNADFKFFLTANLDVRASRRFDEFKKIRPNITLEEVKVEIDKRDHDDQEREFGQLRPAQNAIFVDTSNLDLNGVVNLIVNIIQNKK